MEKKDPQHGEKKPSGNGRTGRPKKEGLNRKDFKISYRIKNAELEGLKKTVEKYKLKSIHHLAKKALLEGEITINTRNRSIDSINETLLQCKADLNRVGNNINQVVKNFNTIKLMVPNEALRLSKEISELRKLEKQLNENLEKVYEIWLQS